MDLRGFLFVLFFCCGILFGQSESLEIRQAIQGLRSYHYAHQKAAIQKLIQIGDPAVPELIKSLRTASDLRFQEGLRITLAKQGQKVVSHLLMEIETNPSNSLNMIAALGLMSRIEEDITDKILPLLKDSSDIQKMYVLSVLGKMSHTPSYSKAMAVICKATANKKISVRMQALISLRNFATQAEEVIPFLIDAAQEPKVKRVALESMGKMNSSNSSMLQVLVENLEGNQQSTAALALISIGAQADDFLIEQLKNSEVTPKQKQRILDILAAVRREENQLEDLRQTLLLFLEDKQLCQKVLQILGVIGTSKGAEKHIIECLKEPELRYEAIQVLGRIKDNIPDNTSHLIPLLKEKKWRLVVLNALQEMGEAASKAVPHLLELLAEDSPELHRRVGATLKKLGKRAINDLEILLQSAEPPRGLFIAIREMGKNAAPLVPYMLTNLDTKSENTLIQILEALSDIRENIHPSLKIVSELMVHPNTQIQNRAIEVVGKVGSQAKSAVPKLVELLPNAKPRTAFQILTALGRIGASAESALPALEKLRKNTNNPYLKSLIPSVQARIRDQVKKMGTASQNNK